MTQVRLNEETVRRLPVPSKGNRVTYFAGATIQGAKAPRGFGLRVTAAGARSFVLNYRLRGRERRLTIGIDQGDVLTPRRLTILVSRCHARLQF